MTNYAAPGARVGFQTDGDVVIQGDLTVSTPAPTRPGPDREGKRDPGPGRTGTAANTARDGDVTGIQTQHLAIGRRNRRR